MPMVYEDLQSLESKKKNPGVRNGLPAPQVFLQDLCSGSRPLLLSLGLSLLLLIGIRVIGAKNSKTQRELETLRATFSNFSSNITAEVQELRTLGGSLQEKTTSLKASVENLGQQLQAGYSDTVLRIQELVKDLNSLRWQMTELRNNGSQKSCCPVNWLEHEGSCYFFSHTEKSWSEAEKYCRLENAHLVVVGSLEEQVFLMQHTSSVNTWIGLTDQDGPWRWVDGTDYETGFKFWSPEQPDNWSGHGLWGNEDCAHITYNNQWNDNICSRLHRWVCEIELYRAS